MYVCLCHSVTDRDIHEAVVNGVNDLRQLSRELKVGTCCGKCTGCAREVIQEAKAHCAQACAQVVHLSESQVA